MSQQKKERSQNRSNMKDETKKNRVQSVAKAKKSFKANYKVIIEVLLLLIVCGTVLYKIKQLFSVVLLIFVCVYLICIIVAVLKYCFGKSYNEIWFVGWIAKICKKTYGAHESCSNFVHGFFIIIDTLITGKLFYALISEKNCLMGADNIEHALLNYVLFIGSNFLIHMWIYMAVKFCMGAKEVDDYFSDKSQNDNDLAYQDIWNDEKRIMNPLPIRCANCFEYIVKVIYLLLWLEMDCN